MSQTDQISELDLALFAEITRRYFERTMGEAVALDRASVCFTPPHFEDYTGLIRMSGLHRGYVSLSMGESLLQELLGRVGEPVRDAAMCRDFVGEIASTIASNAREHFGNFLGISTPVALNRTDAARLSWPFSHLSLSFKVLGRDGQLVIALENQSPA